MLLPSKRALLLGGAAAGAFAGGAQADQAFTGFQFKSQSGTVPGRTMPQRLDDVINVKDFGAVGNDSNDDSAAIQAAVNAVQVNGGCLFFPQGVYKITRSIAFNGMSFKSIKILGCGGGFETQDAGSVIHGVNFVGPWANGSGYLFNFTYQTSPAQGGFAVHSIQDLCFWHQNAVTSVVDTETCPGCIHIAQGMFPRIEGCNFKIGAAGGDPNSGGGVCVFTLSQNTKILSCGALGPYGGNNATRSHGFIGSSLDVSNCKMQTLGFAISLAGGGYISDGIISHIDFEKNGTAISLGGCSIGVLDNLSPPASFTIHPPPNGTLSQAVILDCSVEAPGDLDGSSNGVIWQNNSVRSGLFISGFTCVSTGQGGLQPPYGIRLVGGKNIDCNNMFFLSNSGVGYKTACYSFTQCSGLKFTFCQGYNNNAAASNLVWDFSNLNWPTVGLFGVDANGATWDRCSVGGSPVGFDGALPFAKLPPSPQTYGQTMVCSDSPVAATSFGTQVTTGSGANKVLLRWCGNPLGWRIAG